MYTKGNLKALKASLCWVRFPAPAGFTHCSCRYCSYPTENNGYRLVASTSVVLKCFEKHMESLFKVEIRSEFDPLQFAYRQYVASWERERLGPALAALKRHHHNTLVDSMWANNTATCKIIPNATILNGAAVLTAGQMN